MNKKNVWWSRRSFWIWVFVASTLIWVVVGLWLFATRFPTFRPGPPPTPETGPGPEPTSTPSTRVGLDAASLTAAGAFVTSVGSLAAVVLSHLKNQRELELEHRMREKELELEQARLELERIKVEAQREGNDDG